MLLLPLRLLMPCQRLPCYYFTPATLLRLSLPIVFRLLLLMLTPCCCCLPPSCCSFAALYAAAMLISRVAADITLIFAIFSLLIISPPLRHDDAAMPLMMALIFSLRYAMLLRADFAAGYFPAPCRHCRCCRNTIPPCCHIVTLSFDTAADIAAISFRCCRCLIFFRHA